MHPSRRGVLTGLASLFAAPAIVRADSLMIIKPLPFESYLEIIKTGKFADGTEWTITDRVLGNPSNIETWRDMKTAMHGWGAYHNDPVQSIRYITKTKIYEHGDCSWVPMDPHVATMRLHAKV